METKVLMPLEFISRDTYYIRFLFNISNLSKNQETTEKLENVESNSNLYNPVFNHKFEATMSEILFLTAGLLSGLFSVFTALYI